MKKTVKLLVICVLLIALVTQIEINQEYPSLQYETSNLDRIQQSINEIHADPITAAKNALNLTIYDTEQTISSGKTLFDVKIHNYTSGAREDRVSFIVDMEGNVLKTLHAGGDVEFIDSNTIMFADRGSPNVTFYDLKDDTEVNYTIGKTGHHDIEYNPFTEEFLVMEAEQYGTYGGFPIQYDSFYQFNKTGEELWYWNGSIHLPFDEEYFNNETMRGSQHWTHGNSIFWDLEHEVFYYNARHIDTFFKIDLNTGDIIWSVGRYKEAHVNPLTCYNKAGEQVDTMFYHAHSVERISENRFILFDNDYWNLTTANPATNIGTSRMVEVEIDETAGTATEVWSWSGLPKEEYYSSPWGDADRLPDGNSLGVFGWSAPNDPPMYVTEVTSAGDKVWEMNLINTEDYYFTGYRAERFYDHPFIEEETIVQQGDTLVANFTTWNTFKQRHHDNFTLRIIHDKEFVLQQELQFLPYWQPTTVNLDLSDLELEVREGDSLGISVTNSDGHNYQKTVDVSTETGDSAPSFGMVLSLLSIQTIVILRNLNNKRK